jgi:hypothetical protein
MALELAQPLTVMSTGSSWGGGVQALPARKADNLTATCEPNVYRMWEPRRLTTYGPPWPITGLTLLFSHN